MTSIESFVLEVPDPTAARAFYDAAFGDGAHVDLRASDAPTTGFRSFTLSLLVSQPADVDALVHAALDAGAAPLKPVKKSLWGYGGVVSAPDGTIRKVATSSKKNTGPATHVKLALYGRRALAKDAGVSPDGTGSHRIAIRGDAGSFADPDGFVWEPAEVPTSHGADARNS